MACEGDDRDIGLIFLRAFALHLARAHRGHRRATRV
jgi:hypothetical protein